MQKFLKGNYTEDEIRTYLKIDGYSDSNINRLILEYRKLKKQQEEKSQIFLQQVPAQKEEIKIQEEIYPDTTKVKPVLIEEKLEKKKKFILEPFGLDIFRKAGTLFQPNIMGPVDENYKLGPGDEIILVITGDVEKELKTTVNREGLLYVPYIGQVSVNGLTLSGLRKRLFRKLSKKFSGLTGDENATTFFEVSLGKLRTIFVIVTGEVNQPGGYNLSAVSTAFTALYFAGGPTEKGSLRHIEVIRNNKVVSKIDFYDYLLKGDSSRDIRLSNGDNVRVPLKKKEVVIRGEVKRPAVYELVDNETLIDLIQIAGGLKATAFIERAQIDRIVPFNERNKYKEDRIVLDINLREILENPDKKITLADGDTITIFPISDEERNFVYIKGSVRRPGKYQFENGMTVKDLIEKSKGLLDEAYRERGEIIRKKEDGSETFISFNLKECLKNNIKENYSLVERDTVKILSRIEVEGLENRRVSISGHVKKPGRYKYIDNMRMLDLLILGDGLLDPDFQKKTYLERGDLIRINKDTNRRELIPLNLRKILEGDSTENIVLQSLDSVRVYGIDEIVPSDSVAIYGEVKFPGKHPFHRGMTLGDLILQAGGINAGAYIDVAEVSRVRFKKGTNSRKVDIIKVPIEIDENFNLVKGENEFLLQKDDNIFLRENPQWELQQNVEITGEVKYPGVYSLLSKKDKLRDLIRRAGGLLPTAFLDGAKFIRRKNNIGRIALNLNDVMKDENSEDNIILFAGDHLHIPEIPKSVKVSGEVGLETSIIYKKGEKIGYYIRRAGGYTANADKNRTVVVQPNGIVEKVRRFWFDPEPKPGSEIMVPPRPEGASKDYFSFIRQVITTISNAAVLVVAIRSRR